MPRVTCHLSPAPWPRHRWWLFIALVFGAHVGFIFALADHKSTPSRAAGRAPELRLVTAPSELLALDDPTLFARPHAKGFAAAAWVRFPEIEFPPFRWTEAPRWLALPVEELGATLQRFAQTNVFARFEFDAMPAPELSSPAVQPPAAANPLSVLRVAGDLAQRQLLTRIELTNWPSADLLTNTVVQVLVDAAGNIVSHTVLRPDGGSKDPDQQRADQRALELARTARFAPLPSAAKVPPSPLERLTRGLMVFEWSTVPLPPTNAPAKP